MKGVKRLLTGFQEKVSNQGANIREDAVRTDHFITAKTKEDEGIFSLCQAWLGDLRGKGNVGSVNFMQHLKLQ